MMVAVGVPVGRPSLPSKVRVHNAVMPLTGCHFSAAVYHTSPTSDSTLTKMTGTRPGPPAKEGFGEASSLDLLKAALLIGRAH